jgi:GNAT superfamily N-acetyltransferase
VSTAELRLATEADLGRVLRLVHGTMPPAAVAVSSARRDRIHRRLRGALDSDPAGCLVLEDGAGLVGFACAVQREGVWALTSLAVAPDAQGEGHGRRLMGAALAYGRECHGFLVAASDDERAWRTYSGAGFALVPTISAHGSVDRSTVPASEDVRDGDAGDLERCAEVDRRVRGGGRTVDLEGLLAEPDARLYVSDRGYAMAGAERVLVLAAENEDEAAALLWRALADAPRDVDFWVRWISGAQQWAVRVVLAARLTPLPGDPYFTRGRLGPLWPWLPHSGLL